MSTKLERRAGRATKVLQTGNVTAAQSEIARAVAAGMDWREVEEHLDIPADEAEVLFWQAYGVAVVERDD